VNFSRLPDDWPTQRNELKRLATHVLGQARHRLDGLFDLVPLVGGFGTPPVGADRERVRIVGGSLFVERVKGVVVTDLEASTTIATIAGSTVRELCRFVGFELDPDFWTGDDTPALGDPDAPISLDGEAADTLGDWFLLGQRAIDLAIASVPDPAASVGRLWPEHFDYGVDLAAAPGVRCNLGASPGDGFHPDPYLYLGPWDAGRPGPAGYWNAPFGAILAFGDLDMSEHPVGAATEFFLQGIAYLRSA